MPLFLLYLSLNELNNITYMFTLYLVYFGSHSSGDPFVYNMRVQKRLTYPWIAENRRVPLQLSTNIYRSKNKICARLYEILISQP